jgi:hypothetical protein
MDKEVLMFIQSISGWIIVALLGIIAYFLRDSNHKMTAQIEALNDIMRSFEMRFIKKDSTDDIKWTNCEDRHETISNRLTEHGKKLDQHEVEISVLKERTKYTKLQ